MLSIIIVTTPFILGGDIIILDRLLYYKGLGVVQINLS
jgi:hypothetical protein